MSMPKKTLRWFAGGPLAILSLYVLTYFFAGRHTTGLTFESIPGGTRNFTCHDRSYSFDPWIYQPLGVMETMLRGRRVQVVLDSQKDLRAGQPT